MKDISCCLADRRRHGGENQAQKGQNPPISLSDVDESHDISHKKKVLRQVGSCGFCKQLTYNFILPYAAKYVHACMLLFAGVKKMQEPDGVKKKKKRQLDDFLRQHALHALQCSSAVSSRTSHLKVSRNTLFLG